MTNKTTQSAKTQKASIPAGWQEVKLGEVAEINMGQSPKSEFYNTQGIGLPFLQGNRTFGIKYPHFDVYCSEPKKIAQKGEVLFSVRAPVGDINIANKKICIGRGLSALQAKNDNNEYLYFLLHYLKNKIINNQSGSVFGAVNKTILSNISIILPPLPEQKAIAEVLSSLDDKIDLLHRQNKTLEDMAQTLFRKWFIDETDEGWEEKPLSYFGDIICGKTPSKKIHKYFGGKIPFIKIPDMHGNTFIFSTTDTLTEEGRDSQKNKTLPEKSICVSCIATVGLISMNAYKSQTNQQINSIIPKKDEYRYFLYLFMKSSNDLLHAMASGGTATLNLNTGNFAKILVLYPGKSIIREFHKKVESIFDKIFFNQSQIRTLENLRDTLLPKLMSGEVRVNFTQ